MVSTTKVKNTKNIKIIEIYIWYNGELFIWQSLNNLNFEFLNFDTYMVVFKTLDGLNSKNHEYQDWSTH